MNISLPTQLYSEQRAIWPQFGRHILAGFDADSIWVYQAYNEQIGAFAAKHGRFGDGFSLNRMSWIKPNFLWMMYRSGWGEKPDQTRVLAIRLPRALWDEILSLAVPSAFDAALFSSPDEWKRALASSDVRLQWDPDHDPCGAKQERRAIQLGLRAETLRRYTRELLAIEDVSGFVAAQRPHAQGENLDGLLLPRERVYPVANPETARRLGLDFDS